jgi:hypothetical protein
VATTAEIVIMPAGTELADVAHVSELEDDQAVVEHTTPANCTVPLGAVTPKLRPETVTDPPGCELGSFIAPDFADATGAATRLTSCSEAIRSKPTCM